MRELHDDPVLRENGIPCMLKHTAGEAGSLVAPTAPDARDAHVDLVGQMFIHPGGTVSLTKATCEILIGLPSVKMYINRYPTFAGGTNGLKAVHVIVAETRKARDIEYWRAQGAGELAEARTVVCHLDDNKMNFNVENLMHAPEVVNHWCMKTPGAQKRSIGNQTPKYTKRVSFNDMPVPVKRVTTVSEAEHAYDCAKMFGCPKWAREFIFRYGLIRPSEFADKYTTVDFLVQRYTDNYTARTFKPPTGRTRANRIRILKDDSEWNDDVKSAISESAEPFDPDIDCVVLYSGPKVSFQWIMERACFDTHLGGSNYHILLNNWGYVMVNRTGLHRLVLGLIAGEFNEIGRHGLGGKLDNRKRMLRIGTSADNMRDIPKKNDKSTSAERGVSLASSMKSGWRVRINITRTEYSILSKSHDEAVLISRAVHGAVKELEKLEHNKRKAFIREIVQHIKV